MTKKLMDINGKLAALQRRRCKAIGNEPSQVIFTMSGRRWCVSGATEGVAIQRAMDRRNVRTFVP